MYKKNHFITVTWNINDVWDVAPNLTPEQALEVLHNVKRAHDENRPSNWDLILNTALELFGDSYSEEGRPE